MPIHRLFRDTVTRRAFTRQVASAVVGGTIASGAARPRIDAVLFDAFVVFDPWPVAALAERIFPGRGAELTAAWRTTQFQYAWLRVVARSYADFWHCTADALRHAASMLRLDLTPSRHERLMQAYLDLRPWPEVPPALRTLRASGVRLGILSNFTPEMLASSIRASGLRGVFDRVLSTDDVATYKPDPRAYLLGLHAFGLPRDRIAFAAFAGWDAAGAKLFGYPTLWVNRLGAPADELGAPAPDTIVRSLTELVGFVQATHRQ
jgi:2-haloacid dehalogenase